MCIRIHTFAYTEMVNIYAAGKTKLMSCCCNTVFTVIIFSLFLGLAMVGTANVAASSVSSLRIGGVGEGQALEEEQQQQRQIPQMCSSIGITGSGGTNDNTATGMIAANNNNSALLYQNPEYGIQIRCPPNWGYIEMGFPFEGEFFVIFMSQMDAQQFAMALESGVTPEIPPTMIAVMTMELPFGNIDVQLLMDLLMSNLTPQNRDSNIISTNQSAVLSGMPAIEAIAVQPENRTKSLTVMTITSDRIYGVAYASNESTYEQFLPIAQDMINSFTITNETAISTGLTDNIDNDNTTTTSTGLNTSTITQFQTSESEEDVNSLSFNGFMAIEQGRYQEAIEYLDRALAIDPNNLIALTNKGIALTI
jgi:tetratricopeptide (TPR) repeat protein